MNKHNDPIDCAKQIVETLETQQNDASNECDVLFVMLPCESCTLHGTCDTQARLMRDADDYHIIPNKCDMD
jgi:hypothetical protein